MPGRDVLLVGSIPLTDRHEVLALVAEQLGTGLARVPDGETGVRSNWIGWQRPHFASLPGVEPIDGPEREYQLGPPFRLTGDAGTDSAAASPVEFGPLGFADEAIESHPAFVARRSAGDFADDARLQVSIPTPFAPLYSFVAYESQGAIYPPYETAMLREVARLCDAIPHRDLAIQWDVATEMSIFEGLHPVPFLGPEPRDWLLDRLAQLGDAVPGEVELGYHLCYGSMNNRHWKEPEDLGVCVATANAILDRLGRAVSWFHVPVPVDRADDDYFAPLGELRRSPGTALYLGLLHDADGLDGARRRAAAAARHTDVPFGIATECGLGRRDPADVAAIIELHASAGIAV